jgi:Tfp pilus assembly protein PilF
MDAAAHAEDHDSALARKRSLDQNINLGAKLLTQNKVSEADAAFQDALASYKDEHRAWQMIGKLLLDAGQARRAWPYLKKATELEPQNEVARELFAAATKAREKDA